MTENSTGLKEIRREILETILAHETIKERKVLCLQYLKKHFDFLPFKEFYTITEIEEELRKNPHCVWIGFASQFGSFLDYTGYEEVRRLSDFAIIIGKSLLSGCYGGITLYQKGENARFEERVSKNISYLNLKDQLERREIERYQKGIRKNPPVFIDKEIGSIRNYKYTVHKIWVRDYCGYPRIELREYYAVGGTDDLEELVPRRNEIDPNMLDSYIELLHRARKQIEYRKEEVKNKVGEYSAIYDI